MLGAIAEFERDLNRDGLTDLVMFNTRREDEPIKLLENRGILPGTPPRLSAVPR